MIIGLDYDDTYTADPVFWDKVIDLAIERGHDVHCVTGRDEPPDESEPQLPPGVEVICAGEMFKRHACEAVGIRIDVWIDDCPGLIEPQRKLDW